MSESLIFLAQPLGLRRRRGRGFASPPQFYPGKHTTVVESAANLVDWAFRMTRFSCWPSPSLSFDYRARSCVTRAPASAFASAVVLASAPGLCPVASAQGSWLPLETWILRVSWVTTIDRGPVSHFLPAPEICYLPPYSPCNPQRTSQPRAKSQVSNASNFFSCGFTSFRRLCISCD